ncbi:MAG: hypothetical protein OET41_16285, partial [Xanthomonadales bacterium]|nr:hypothetical protein [Xanthomonadales bacterium]
MINRLFSTVLLAMLLPASPAVYAENIVAEKHPLETFTDGRTVTVYMTAKDTQHRLARTGPHSFEQGDQPSEGEVSVFVN